MVTDKDIIRGIAKNQEFFIARRETISKKMALKNLTFFFIYYKKIESSSTIYTYNN
jgi:hypothetical protein